MEKGLYPSRDIKKLELDRTSGGSLGSYFSKNLWPLAPQDFQKINIREKNHECLYFIPKSTNSTDLRKIGTLRRPKVWRSWRRGWWSWRYLETVVGWYAKPFPVVSELVTGILGGETRIPSYTFFLKTWMFTVPKVGVELQDKFYCKKKHLSPKKNIRKTSRHPKKSTKHMFIGYLQPILLPKIYSMPADSDFVLNSLGPHPPIPLGTSVPSGRSKAGKHSSAWGAWQNS